MFAVFLVIIVATLAILWEVPGMKRQKQKKELIVFSVGIAVAMALAIAVGLRIQLPNPLALMKYIYQPVSDLFFKTFKSH